jgi:Histone-like transcription factor (CBF/NF-Y) and archaeal histone
MRVRKIMNAESFAMWLLEREKEANDGPCEQRPAKRADHFKFMFSACSEAVMLKAAELFIRELTVRAYSHHTKLGGRKILNQSDVKNAVNDSDTDMYDFLIDIIPRTETNSTSHMNELYQGIQQNQLQVMAAVQNSLPFTTEP